MVHIITGPMNSGKTTKMIEVYKFLNGQNPKDQSPIDYHRLDMNSDGFISEKVMIGSHVKGYKAVQLSSGNKMDLMIREEDLINPVDQLIEAQIGPYCMSKKAVNWIEICIKDMLGFSMKAIFLDEIGPLELDGLGFDLVLKKLLRSRCDVYITVRDQYLSDVIDRYGIEQYQLIKTGES